MPSIYFVLVPLSMILHYAVVRNSLFYQSYYNEKTGTIFFRLILLPLSQVSELKIIDDLFYKTKSFFMS